jgi:hypothetical protein
MRRKRLRERGDGGLVAAVRGFGMGARDDRAQLVVAPGRNVEQQEDLAFLEVVLESLQPRFGHLG